MAPSSGKDDSKAPRPARKGEATRKKRGGRRRRKPKATAKSESVSGALAKKSAVDLAKSSEEPLSQQEARSMREHFQFLRAHRKVLRLKVNAAEDLLLNGVQEPTHRGICQHLLGKVDRSSVLSACERLEPRAAAKLLAGIVLFSSDIEYVLLLLEKIQQSESPANATTALAQGLERIDFDEVSVAQMRRVLSLVTEVFSERERPELLLGLLESRSFRGAVDKSIEDLPGPLASLVVPLRAAQAVILHGKPNRYAPQDLSRGIDLLLGQSERSLRRRPAEVRERLFEHGLQACHAPDHAHHTRLGALLAGFAGKGRQHGEAGSALALHLIGAECDGEARRLLQELVRDHPEFKLPKRWLERLQSPSRIGRFATEDNEAESRDRLDQHVRKPGYWINTMESAWIQTGSEPHLDDMTTTASILFDVCVPNLVPLLESGMTPEGAPYFVTPNPGPPLDTVLQQNRGLDLGEAVQLCLAGVNLFGALASAGVAMSDGELPRFSLADGNTLWLVDVAGARRVDPSDAASPNLAAAMEFCAKVLENGPRYLAPLDLLAEIQACGSCSELARALARTSRSGARALTRSTRKRSRKRARVRRPSARS